MNLTVEGKLEAKSEGETVAPADSSQVPTYYSGPASAPLSVSTEPQNYPQNTGYPADTAPANSPAAQPQAPANTGGAPVPGTIRDAGEYAGHEEGNSPVEPESAGVFSSMISGTGFLVFVGIGIVGLLVIRRIRTRSSGGSKDEIVDEELDDESNSLNANENFGWQTQDPNASMVRANGSSAANGHSRERKAVVTSPVTVPSSLFGAYRIDQEVGKLTLGQPHRMDVLASRATEDRRAIEASLVKTLIAPESSDDERRRARTALEEYGFVARQCAALLSATSAFDRTSAARALGEMGSVAALPFLLESLYDLESIVRNQAVVSIGELKVPSAIGALLDMARKHPDVPSGLVSRALNACSVDGLDFFDVVPRGSLSAGFHEAASMDITHLEPASTVEDLPDDLSDPELAAALAAAFSAEVNERSEAVKQLAQYEVRSAVDVLASIAKDDNEPSVRSHAVSSLASINHESVFSAVLIALADESREVRASAARALSRLSFDRADAYVRVIETSDAQTLKEVAEACIKAGIVSQNIDRLDSGDHRQAYEAFSLISLLVKAKLPTPVINAISQHQKLNVSLSAIHLLSTTGDGDVLDLLRSLAQKNEISDEIKTALLDGIYKLEQSRAKEEEAPQEFKPHLSEPEDYNSVNLNQAADAVLHTDLEEVQTVEQVNP
jgi:HEAT repeat protein